MCIKPLPNLETRAAVSCTLSFQRGISLIELIMFIVIIGIGLTGIMLVINQTSGHSADTLLRQQAQTIAESLLEEIEAHDFALSAVAVINSANQASRTTTYHNVMDYNGFSPTGIFTSDGTAVSGLSGYTVSAVQVVPIVTGELGATIPGGSVASAVRITVQVTDPAGNLIAATGYRLNY